MNPLHGIRELYRRMSPCVLCPHRCGARRLEGERGRCGAGAEIELASATIHNGEEPPISGTLGSGTLFFTHCPLSCLYCQNWPISQQGVGRKMSADGLAERMLQLQRRGVHNINLVNPTHYWPQIAAAVYLARARGLRVPVLANIHGFENTETLRLLADVVQIWLPDVKTLSSRFAGEICGTPRLAVASWQTLEFLATLSGPLQVDENGLALRGVLVRHLVLPGGRSDTPRFLRRLRRRFRGRIPVSLMTQYFPAHRAHDNPVFQRPLSRPVRRRAHRLARALHLSRGWRQMNG
ncbi:MAG: hypothetical protein P9L99_19195 [Candidatus Lernaella stagnicola]|nr:hypothetical protein [Candidatus Lernaella stagnicola]